MSKENALPVLRRINANKNPNKCCDSKIIKESKGNMIKYSKIHQNCLINYKIGWIIHAFCMNNLVHLHSIILQVLYIFIVFPYIFVY